MKGIVFTEFTEMIENKFGLEILDKVLYDSNLKSEGVYTGVGTYDHDELFKMVNKLSSIVNKPIPDLLKNFGEYMLEYFVKNYSIFFNKFTNVLDFIESIENHIHIEVVKLYPDAELPKFAYKREGPNCLIMVYNSERKLSHFAEGLIIGSARHFNQEISMTIKDLSNGNGTKVQFRIEIC